MKDLGQSLYFCFRNIFTFSGSFWLIPIKYGQSNIFLYCYTVFIFILNTAKLNECIAYNICTHLYYWYYHWRIIFLLQYGYFSLDLKYKIMVVVVLQNYSVWWNIYYLAKKIYLCHPKKRVSLALGLGCTPNLKSYTYW